MIIPDGYAQANLRFTGVAVPTGAEITIGLGSVGASSPIALGEIVFDAFNDANVMDSFSTNITASSVYVKFGPNEDGASGEFVGESNSGVGGAAAPPNVSVLVTKVTASGGRKGRGRFFVPGFPEGLIDAGGVVNPTQLTTMQGDFDAFLDNINTAGFPVVLLHGDSTTPTTVTDLIVAPLVATQRRRLRR